MNLLGDALVWLNDPLNWQGKTGVPFLTYEHLYISFLAVLIAAVIAVPTALVLGHVGRGGGLTVVVSNVSRAIPTLALLTIFAATAIGFGNRATIIALAVFAVPPLLTNTYVGIREVDRDVVEAARGMGLSERSVLLRVELPLAVPLIAAGFRTAAVQVVATATLAALVGGGGLGRIITDGFGQQDRPQILAGGILVALLALLTEGALASVQRAVTPGRDRKRLLRGVRRGDPAEEAVPVS
ncbi:MAG TPA: ABC transporter permease [Actinomycetes bacterium]|nr:ABC transporter permease [Actinomycetes bacterium]